MTDITDTEHGEQVRERLAAATPGPWSADQHWAVIAHGPDSVLHGYVLTDCACCGDHIKEDASVSISAEDADLIAHAPGDLARLLTRAEAAEAALARVEAIVGPTVWQTLMGTTKWIELRAALDGRSLAAPPEQDACGCTLTRTTYVCTRPSDHLSPAHSGVGSESVHPCCDAVHPHYGQVEEGRA